MKSFTIYNTTTGDIGATGHLSNDADFDSQEIPAGHAIIEAESNRLTQRVDIEADPHVVVDL